MRKNIVLGKFNSQLHLQCFQFPKSLILLFVVHLKEKKYDFSEFEIIMYMHMIRPLEMAKFATEFKNQDVHDLFLETIF